MSAAVGPMTLVELIDRHKKLFYLGYKQWWLGEAFTRELPTDPLPPFPHKVTRRGNIPSGKAEQYPRAVDLVTHFVQNPDSEFWKQGYRFWCSDKDAAGRRVYLMWHNGLMEIHRWDEPDMSWVCAA